MRQLLAEFQQLTTLDERARGLQFEEFLRRLFALHDLDPNAAFTAPGEQTDGSIRLDQTLYLVEARLRAGRSSPADVRAFRQKVEDKLDNTLGIFISMSGFTEEAIQKASLPPARVILVDGIDLGTILQGVNDLVQVLRRKVRRAGETGDVFFRC